MNGTPTATMQQDDLPFTNDTPTAKDDQWQAHEARVLRFQYGCPHCGHQVTVTIE